MNCRNLLLPIVMLCTALAAAEETSWIERDGQTYGAKPDERGPIGGGDGYTHIVTKGDFTATSPEQIAEALKKAKPGQIVFIPGETEVDLTTLIYIEKFVLEVPEGVALAGNRGHKGSKGAILTSDALDTPVMIKTLGPNVRITGLRIRGPNPKRYLDHHRRGYVLGGKEGFDNKYYYKFPNSIGISTLHARLRVDNCDISGFANAGIGLVGTQGHRVHHCFIHHCQQQGLGYGISVSRGSSLIEYNLFDFNRHSIASSGKPGSSYVARHNVELGVALSHCFDMHGGRDRLDGTNVAGTSIEIYNNTFRAPQTPVVIRGVPQEKCDVHHNWFLKHDAPDRAVIAQAKTKVFGNAYGPPPPRGRRQG